MDGQTDVGHINLIGGLVTRHPAKNSIDPQPGEIVYNTMRYRRNTKQRTGNFQSKECDTMLHSYTPN